MYILFDASGILNNIKITFKLLLISIGCVDNDNYFS